MRHILKALTVATIVLLAAGPVLAAPLVFPAGSPVVTSGASRSPAPTIPWVSVTLGLGALGITIRKDIGSIAAKYVTRAGAAAGDYKDGVSGAGSTWESNAGGSEANWEQGTQAAIGDKRFAKGVAGKAAKYQTNAVNLGSQRYAPGVANAKDAYSRGMAPVLSTLSGLTLPPKGPRRSPQNQARSNAVALALGAMKVGR
jgi:hypothetical protein